MSESYTTLEESYKSLGLFLYCLHKDYNAIITCRSYFNTDINYQYVDNGSSKLYDVNVTTIYGSKFHHNFKLPSDLNIFDENNQIIQKIKFNFDYEPNVFDVLIFNNQKYVLKDLVSIGKISLHRDGKLYKYNFLTKDKINNLADNEYYVSVKTNVFIAYPIEEDLPYSEELTNYFHNHFPDYTCHLYKHKPGIDEIRMKQMYGS